MNDILVVVDMQNDFITGSLGTAEGQAIVDRVVNRIRQHQGNIFVTRDTHADDYMTRQEGHHLPVPHCEAGTEGWQLVPAVADALAGRQVTYFDKPTFGSPELAMALKSLDDEKRLTAITLVGVCTDICVISNALLIKAFLPEVPIYVDASACAGVSPESHERALEAMAVCQVNISHA